jgi:hypothetical protein
MANPSKIPGQPEELEFANLVDIYSADLCSSKTGEGPRWIDWGMPAKRRDPGRPVIIITIGAYTFENALCDFGSSVNIMPKVIYNKINGSPLLYTTMCLQLADLSLCHPKGILDDVCLGVGRSYVAADFVVVETGGSENAPIILGRPFLAIAKAIIYADVALRSSSPSMGERRDSISRTISLKLLHIPNILTLKNTSQLSRRREEIEGGIRRTIDLNRMWRKFG